MELNEDEDPLPEMQDMDYRMCHSSSNSAESVDSLAISDVCEGSVECLKSAERVVDTPTQISPSSNLSYPLNASSSVKQAVIDKLSYRFSLEQIQDDNTVDEDEYPFIGQKRKCSSSSLHDSSAKRQCEDHALGNDELSVAIAPFDITQKLMKMSSQVPEESNGINTSTSSDSSGSTVTEFCDESINSSVRMIPPSTLANDAVSSWAECTDPFRLLTFINKSSTSDEDNTSATVSVQGSDESFSSSFSEENPIATTCSSSLSSERVFENKRQYGSSVNAKERGKIQLHSTAEYCYQPLFPDRPRGDYCTFQTCKPSEICTKGPRLPKKCF